MAIWSEDQWWLADEYARFYEGRISPEQISRSIEAVMRVFDESWAKSTDAHPAYGHLLSQGLDPLQFLISLGHNLLAVGDSPGFRGVLEDLRDPQNYESAILELSLAALLRDAGHEIGFHPKLQNGKKSDVVARMYDQEVFFEVKIVRESQSAQALSAFTLRLVMAVGDVTRSLGDHIAGIQFRIELNSELAAAFGAGPEVDSETINGLIDRARTEVTEHLERGDRDFRIPHFGSFAFRTKEIIPDSGVSCRNVSPSFELKRIMQSGLRDAINQLPIDRPGLMVIRTAGVLEEGQSRLMVESFFKGKGSRAAHVSGVIFLPVFYSIPSRWSHFAGFAVENPSARFPLPDGLTPIVRPLIIHEMLNEYIWVQTM